MFNKDIFKKSEIVDNILGQMDQGSKVYSILNTLMLTDITKWDNEQLL